MVRGCAPPAHRPGATPGARTTARYPRAVTTEPNDLSRLADHLPVGLVRIASDRRIDRANEVAHVLLGRSPGALLGRTVMEAFLDHRLEALVVDQPGVNGSVLELDGPQDRRIVVRARPATGALAWLVMEDVTELRRLQRIRAEFIDNLSHELRTPLTTVRLLTERLTMDLEGLDVSERVRDRVAKIDVETGHLVQMVNELLDLSRIEQATTRLDLDDLPAGTLLNGVAARMAAFAERQSVTVVVEPGPPGITLRGDADRLGQVLVNLLHNALKFSSPGSTVTLRAEHAGPEVRILVIDQGPGIPRADQPRIFERFYKVDRARPRTGGGTGLGLAIARHIVEAHGGRIGVESEEGQGATFVVTLPAARG